MIYMEPASLGWVVQIDSWFNTFPEHLTDGHKQLLRTLFHRHVDFAYALISKRLVHELQATSRKTCAVSTNLYIADVISFAQYMRH